MLTVKDFSQALLGAQVTIHVGSGANSKTYHVPKQLLCAHGWFEKALQQGRFQEGNEQVLWLPQDPPTSFQYFVYYLYYQDVRFPDPPTDTREALQLHLREVAELWVFGDKYDLPRLQNCAMFELCRALKHGLQDAADALLDHGTLDYIFAHTAKESPLRTLAADCIVYHLEIQHGSVEEYDFLAAHAGFISDVYLARTEYQSSQDPDMEGTFPRFLQPYRNWDALAVYGRDYGTFDPPFNSRARWGGGLPALFCDYCGVPGAVLRCKSAGDGDGEGAQQLDWVQMCPCGKRDMAQLCEGCWARVPKS